MTAGVLLTGLALLAGSAVLISADDRRPAPVSGGPATPLWADEFDGPEGTPPDPRNWTPETGYGWGDGELQAYTERPENASLDGLGHLAITARPERYETPGGTAAYTSARLNTRHKFAFAYGRLEARIKVPAGRGLVSAFWALGADHDSVGWPESGEIDVMEVNGAFPSTVQGTLHGPRLGHIDYTVAAKYTARRALSEGFHVYGVSWSPGRIDFSLDDRVYAVRRPADLPEGSRWRFEQPFFLLFTLAVGPRWAPPPDDTTPWPATMLVDWVRVWPSARTVVDER